MLYAFETPSVNTSYKKEEEKAFLQKWIFGKIVAKKARLEKIRNNREFDRSWR